MPDSYREQVGYGFAAFLASKGVLSWDADYAYTPDDEWPTYVQSDAPKTPDRLVHIAVGPQTFIRADVVTSIQVRVRGGQDDTESVASDKMQQIQDILYPNGFPLVHTLMGGVRVGIARPGGLLPLTADQSRRFAVVINYMLRTRRPRPGTTPQPPTGSVYGTGIYGEGIYGQ